MAETTILDFRDAMNQVTELTVNPDVHIVLATASGVTDETMPYANFLAWMGSSTGAALSVAADGLQVSATALGDGLTGGGASVITVDITSLTDSGGPLAGTDELMYWSGAQLRKVTAANLLDQAAGNTDLSNTPTATTVVVESSTGNDTTLVSASGAQAGVLTAADWTRLDNAISNVDLLATPTASQVTIDAQTGGTTAIIALAGGGNAGLVTENERNAITTALQPGQVDLGTTPSPSQVEITNTAGDNATLDLVGVNAGLMSPDDKTLLGTALQAVDLGTTPSPTQVEITNTGGTNATLDLVGVNAGLMDPADKTKLDGLGTIGGRDTRTGVTWTTHGLVAGDLPQAIRYQASGVPAKADSSAPETTHTDFVVAIEDANTVTVQHDGYHDKPGHGLTVDEFYGLKADGTWTDDVDELNQTTRDMVAYVVDANTLLLLGADYRDDYDTAAENFNVRDYGAAGDGIADDTSAILDTVAALRSSSGSLGGGGLLYFPSGRYRITATIDLNNIRGLVVRGDGGHTFVNNPNPSFPQSFSVIEWDGPTGGTVIRYSGSECGIYDIAIWGQSPADADGDRAGTGFLLARDPGLGSGHMRIDNFHVSHCDIGWRCDPTPETGNCADLDFGYIEINDCESPFKVTNTNGVNYHFEQFYVRDSRGGLKATFTVDHVADSERCDSTGHALKDGDSVQLTTSGALPSPLVAGTTYWVVNATTDAFEISATRTGGPITFTDSGSGSHTASVNGACLDFIAGGDLRVDYMHSVRTPRVLRISGDGSDTGENNANFNIQQIKFDNQQAVKPQIVDVSDPTSLGDRVIRIGMIRSGDAAFNQTGEPVFSVAGSCDLRVVDFTFMPIEQTLLSLDGTGTFKPRVKFVRCRIHQNGQPPSWESQPVWVTETGSGSVWGAESCYDKDSNLQLSDIGSDVHLSKIHTSGGAEATPNVLLVGNGGTLVSGTSAPLTTVQYLGGFDGMTFTHLLNANDTVQHGTGPDQISLNGAIDFPVGSGGGTLTIRRIDGRWREIGRATF